MSRAMDPVNILISSAGRRVSLLQAFRDALARLGIAGCVFAADASRLSSAAWAADESFLVPECESEEFLPEMLRLCASRNIGLVIPTIDPELEVYASSRHRFLDAGTTVAVSCPETIRITTDKMATYRWLTEHGFPTADTRRIADALAVSAGIALPAVVKPRQGSASKGVQWVTDRRALSQLDGDYVVQSAARGKEYTLDVLVDGAGHAVCAVPRLRIEVRSGEVSKAVTVRSAPLQSLALTVAEALPGAYGAINIQLFWDQETRVATLIEINARFGGGFPLSWHAGGRFPQWIIEDILSYPSSASPNGWHDNLLMLRYDEAIFVDNQTRVLEQPQ